MDRYVNGRHACPGGVCRAQIEARLVACDQCWATVPRQMKRDLGIAYARRKAKPAEYGEARDRIKHWLRTGSEQR